MALTGLDIYKLLPKTNCKECGLPTCLAFAMKLAQKQTTLDKCPYVSEEAKAALSGAAAPPIRLVTIGTGEQKIELGNETVLFRHDETFYHPAGIAVTVADSLGEQALKERVAQIKVLRFERVGQMLSVNLVAVENVSGQKGPFVAAVKAVAASTDLPLILMAGSPDIAVAALEACADKKPLLYAARADQPDSQGAMFELAKKHACPLALHADGLEALAALSEKAKAAGVEDLILDSGAREPAKVLADQTAIRRAALRKKFRPLGYPTMAFTSAEDATAEVLQASAYVAKYAGIVVINGDQPWQALPLLTVRQNIYTDPQKPIQIAAGIYQVGTPDEKSPVLVTTNFSLTYFTVEADVEASKVPSWIVVVDTEGTSVLTAWASEKFTAESIAKALKGTGIEQKVGHRKVVIPGGVAVLSGKLEEAAGWKVIVGPRESSGIPSFLKTAWAA